MINLSSLVGGLLNRGLDNVVQGFTNNITSSLNDVTPSFGGVSSGTTGGDPGTARSTYAFEQVYALLQPFQFPSGVGSTHPLNPIMETGGVIFPYNPTISEGVNVKYDSIELAHTNEAYYAYKGTDNVRINISDAVWTCDTFANAVYALSVLHFFRSYSLMDFGRFKSGRPPSPMWFSAYGNYAFNRVPCLLEKADWSFPNDVDYIGVPEFGSSEYQSGSLQTNRNASGNYTWLPMKFSISSINLLVQHSPAYWTNFSLGDYWSGEMLRRDGNFHSIGPAPSSASSSSSITEN